MLYYIYESYPEAGPQDSDCEPIDCFEADSKKEANEYFNKYRAQNESSDIVLSCQI